MAELQMFVNYLKKDELIYELVLRGVEVTSSESTEKLRAYLRPLLKLEKLNKSVRYPEYSHDPNVEFTVVNEKFLELQEAFKIPKPNLTSITSRLAHLLKRFERIPTDRLTQDNVLEQAALNSLLAEFVQKIAPPADTDPIGAALLHSVQLIDTDSDSSDGADVGLANASHSTAIVKPVSEPIRKWNLKFSGDLKGVSVHNFLERVDELKVARNVNDEQLFASAIDLFEGKALLWYRSNRSRFTTWKALASLLSKHYEPPDYRSRLLNDIMSRTQDTSEGIVEYLSCMTAMFRRYGQVTEELQLGIITRNLAPFYSTQLPVVRTLEELEDACIKLETKKYRADNYVPPSRKRNSYVEPDLAFVSGPSCSAWSAPVHEMHSVPDNRRVSANRNVTFDRGSSVNRNAACWNCQKLGHHISECDSPKKLFCYGCGTQNVTLRTCPHCAKSGNGYRRN